MLNGALQVQMLDRFVIRKGDKDIQISSRSHKLCMLLAVLICQRNRSIPFQDLTSLLWAEEIQSPKTFNALKAILHRARTCLDTLEKDLGRTLILSLDGCFQWSPDVPLTLDVEEFSLRCGEMKQAKNEEQALNAGLKALSLYQGDFLPPLNRFPWAAAQSQLLHQQYLHTVLSVLPLLESQTRWQEASQLAGAALALEPCCEELCAKQMEALLHLNRQQEAVQVYERFQDRLLTQSGVMPSDALRTLCQKARQDRDPRILSPDTLLDRLSEVPKPGPLLCGFDFFQILCHAAARQSQRSGDPVHVALFSLSGPEGHSLRRYSLDRAMDNLQDIILNRLRRGDAAARCGSSQFVLLLPQAGLENSKTVCRQINQTFTRQFPHSPAVLSVSVLPLSFNENQ